MSTTLELILRQCTGINAVRKKNENSYSQQYTEEFYKIGDIKLPAEDIFIEIKATATKGTIGKIVDIEGLATYSERYADTGSYAGDTRIVTWDTTLIYEVEGRKQTGRIGDEYTRIVSGHPETKYVRNINKHKKVKIKNPINKYKQEMKRGDWVIGVKQSGKSLGIGRITRWTNKNVWGVTGDDIDDKSKEFMFSSIKETFTMPNDEHVPLLTMAVLKGWHGE